MRYKFYYIVSAFFLIGCSNDTSMEKTDPEIPQTNLEIRVGEAVRTRAEQSGMEVSFTNGDRVGVFAVDQQGNVIASDVIFTYTNGDWKTNSPIRFSQNYTYYAYYPATGTSGAPSPTGLPAVASSVGTDIEATTFFSSLISNWTPLADQSSMSNFTKSDLMVARGAPWGTGVYFPMEHMMGMAQISLESRILSTTKQLIMRVDEDYYWTSSAGLEENVEASTAFSNGKIPLNIDDSYYYLINPQKVAVTLSASDTGYNFDNSWSQSLSGIQAGKFQSYTKTPNMNQDIKSTTVSYTIELGDRFYIDGSLSHVSDPIPNGKIPVGVVLYVGNDADITEGWGHGLVVALKNAAAPGETVFFDGPYNSTNGRYVFPSSIQDYFSSWKECHYGIGLAMTDYGGHDRTLNTFVDGKVPSSAARAALNYTAGGLVPKKTDKTSGEGRSSCWFLPAAGQWGAVFNMLGANIPLADPQMTDGFVATQSSAKFLSNLNRYVAEAAANNLDYYEVVSDNDNTSRYHTASVYLHGSWAHQYFLRDDGIGFWGGAIDDTSSCAVRSFIAI